MAAGTPRRRSFWREHQQDAIAHKRPRGKARTRQCTVREGARQIFVADLHSDGASPCGSSSGYVEKPPDLTIFEKFAQAAANLGGFSE
jgi:hypothetical protein